MLLVALDYVFDQRAVFRQEHACNLETLTVPHFRRPNLDVLLRALFFLHFGGLEAYFRANAEVRDDVENDLFQHRIFGKLLKHVALGVQLI